MKKILVLCIDGVEEIECLSVVDFCRRAGIEVTTASVTGHQQVKGSHNIAFHTDTVFEDVDKDSYDGLVLPGGPGTDNLGKTAGVRELAAKYFESGKMLAAICAAPGMISETGLIKGKTATGFPGCKPDGMAEWTENSTEADGNLITAKGAGAASLFAIEIIRYLMGADMATQIYESIQMPIIN